MDGLFNQSALVNGLTIISQIFYTVCFIPQIITNYRFKSGRGVSDGFLFLYLNGYASLLYYIFLLNLPIAYRVLVPLQALFTLVFIAQRLWYDKKVLKNNLTYIFFVNFVAWLCLLFYALANPFVMGNVAGWVTVVVGGVSQLPQVIKIFKEQSVKGFDIKFVYLNLAAGLVEYLAAVIGGLPIQTHFTSLRAALFAVMFLVQFRLYKKTL